MCARMVGYSSLQMDIKPRLGAIVHFMEVIGKVHIHVGDVPIDDVATCGRASCRQLGNKSSGPLKTCNTDVQ